MTTSAAVVLKPTRCAICGTEGNADVVYPPRFNEAALNAAVFSARRVPDRTHYRIVECRSCGLVRSDPIADPGLLPALYAEADFSYGAEIASLRETYGRYLGELEEVVERRDALLEIGCGNGFVLAEALRRGWRVVRGVEPSRAALAEAAEAVRDSIVCDVMRPGLFEPQSFDGICMFQTLDHIPDPGVLLDECWIVLRPGGAILCLNHNVAALTARIGGERSPIIDVEHTYLYSPTTLAQLLENHGFRVRRAGGVQNTYSLRYLAHLLPIPPRAKLPLLAFLERNRLGRIRATLPLGNFFVVAERAAKRYVNADAHDRAST